MGRLTDGDPARKLSYSVFDKTVNYVDLQACGIIVISYPEYQCFSVLTATNT